jgi:hypothetical protein
VWQQRGQLYLINQTPNTVEGNRHYNSRAMSTINDVPCELERHIASLCESTQALALVCRAWRSAAESAESHEPYSANGSTWCWKSAVKNGPVHMRYLRRIDLTLYGAPPADGGLDGGLDGLQLLYSAAAASGGAPCGPAKPLALWVSDDTFERCGQAAARRFIAARTWTVFSCIDYDWRTAFHGSISVDAEEVHLNASLMAIAKLGPSVKRLFVYEDPAAVWSADAVCLESEAFIRAISLSTLESLTFQGLLCARVFQDAEARHRRSFDPGWAPLAPLAPLAALRSLTLLHTTRAPWSQDMGSFLGRMAPGLESLRIYGSNLIGDDLVGLQIERWAASLKSLDLEGNHTLRWLPSTLLSSFAGLEALALANTGIEGPPDALLALRRPLKSLTCNYGAQWQSRWAAAMACQALESVKLVFTSFWRAVVYPHEALKTASLIELDLKDMYLSRSQCFNAARSLTPRALVRPASAF